MRNRETRRNYASMLDYVTREYDEIRSDLFRCLRRRQMNETESEDHISDAMARVLIHHEKYRGELEPSAMLRWLRRVTLNVAFKKYDTQTKRYRILEKHGYSPRLVTRDDDTECRVESRYRWRRVVQEVSTMHPSYIRTFKQLIGDEQGKAHPSYVHRLRVYLQKSEVV